MHITLKAGGKTRPTSSANHKSNQSRLLHTRFPALSVSYMYLLCVLIGLLTSLDCLYLLQLARVIT